MRAPQAVRWQLAHPDEDKSRSLARALSLPLPAARVLVGRGLGAPGEAQAFLSCPLESLEDPFLMRGMDRAADHLARALEGGEPVGLFGDYDVDGVTAAALLYLFIRELGGEAHVYLPHRLREGYGLNEGGLAHLAQKGCRTVVALDCGTSAAEAAGAARGMGLSLIVADHHEPAPASVDRPRLPDVLALLNPLQPGCEYPDKGLCGVGIAFKLALAVRRRLREMGRRGLPNLKQHLDLVALGTVADVAPLAGENRALVRAGLEVLGRSRKPGLRALKEEAGLGEGRVEAGHVGFGLAPRLNAAGRLGEAVLALRLLTAESPGEAVPLARELEGLNLDRQRLQERVLREAQEALEARPGVQERAAIVLGSETWHPGVLGIAAARLAEAYYRPTVLIHLDGGVGKGSARSIPPFDIHRALGRCREFLLQFGGHRGAAGLTLRRQDLEAFRARLEEVAEEELRAEDRVPVLAIDARADLDEVDLGAARSLEGFSPFGHGNPRPVFFAPGLEVLGEPRRVGREGEHLQLTLRVGGPTPGRWTDSGSVDRLRQGGVREAVGFGMGFFRDVPGLLRGRLDVAYTPRVENWGGEERLRIELRGIRGENMEGAARGRS